MRERGLPDPDPPTPGLPAFSGLRASLGIGRSLPGTDRKGARDSSPGLAFT
jgi:hypothetical protein